jgi:hypothetical protein
VALPKDGKDIETAAIGRDGIFGASAAFGLYKSTVRAIVTVEMNASSLTSAQFQKAASFTQAIQRLCINYNEALPAQGRVTAACNALHSAGARLCRWLLQTRKFKISRRWQLLSSLENREGP